MQQTCGKIQSEVATGPTAKRSVSNTNPRQQVAYAATLLQEAAADWWVALLRERSGRRPEDFAEFTVLLCKRFGSSTRVDRARAELRNIRQGQSETVRSYSTRFESLLGKLPTHDREWAKVQFIWGLHQRIAELVTIASPSDLHAAINQAEKIEMARSFAATGQQGPKQGNLNRGRGNFYRGRGRFNAVQVTQGGNSSNTYQPTPQLAVQQSNYAGPRPLGRNQCGKCRGWGHWAKDCPSPANMRGGRGRMMHGRRGGHRGGRRGGGGNPSASNSSVNAALQVSDAGVPGPSVQQVQGTAPVPSQPQCGIRL